ncbi:methionyl-tRNA formyltransferase [candidate division NPL-UPA2 bacterium Unc8]|uniref:Methionyl-tRNA formyltransferase n=1 Tax=candidate division NPL-UPA2 bacterium Unc8 TaxID=1980939 RepID=A0A399FVP5_UNCN2|nr:Methionyl-tRNA formyltransferase [Bacillota bacterium]RII00264.1 MAG: methionyl-tRNA formyltransferase [candidate division NPL-UPA2 bacterium Unc8]
MITRKKKRLRIFFMGTPIFSLPSLISLLQHEKVVGIATQPDKPAGRGRKFTLSAVKEVALHKKISLYQPEKIDGNFLKKLSTLNIDVIVVVAYGKKLPVKLLHIPRLECIAAHPSLLPKYRGAAPIEWAIIRGEKKTGVTIIRVNEEIDAGDIILQEEIDISPDETTQNLGQRLSSLAARMLQESLKQIEAGNAKYTLQQGEVSTARSIRKADGLIRWSSKAHEIHDLVRGLNPRIGAYTHLHRKMLKIWKTEIISNNKASLTNHQLGEIIGLKNGIMVNVAEGAILIKELQPENRRKMSAVEYLSGHTIRIGSLFKDKISG